MWRSGLDLYGPYQVWRGAPGEWPEYEQAGTALSEGVIPDACPRCGGVLFRRRVITNLGEIRQAEFHNGKLVGHAKALAVSIPAPVERWDYDLRHLPACCHLTEAQAAPRERAAEPARAD
jgi:hypothetical protein